MDIALFVLRVVVGLLLAGHGAQKLWGAFGGHGLAGTGAFFESIGMRPGRFNAQLAGTSEFLGGLLLVLGLLTPLGATLIISVMTVAIITVHGKNGPWVTEQGYEYNLVIIATAFVIAAGPGSASMDSALDIGAVHGAGWALAALFAGGIGGALAYFGSHRGLISRAGGEEPRFTRDETTAPTEQQPAEQQPTTRA